MTLDQALEILNKYDGTEMTDEQYYNYHCAQNKITRLILSGEYELVKKEADYKAESTDVFTRKEELSEEESERLIDFITKEGSAE